MSTITNNQDVLALTRMYLKALEEVELLESLNERLKQQIDELKKAQGNKADNNEPNF